jgi:hypothetical protein
MSSSTFKGTCQCGSVQYQIRLKFPPSLDPNVPSVRLYKCNCTTCHTRSFFHCRPISITDDFILTSPSTIEELGEYRCFSKKTAWHFCKACGVNVFAMAGKWEQVELDIGEWSGEGKGKGEVKKVWRSLSDDFTTEVDGKEQKKPYHYLSVNATTLEQAEGLDLREWHEKGWMFYINSRDRTPGQPYMRPTKPYEGGMY